MRAIFEINFRRNTLRRVIASTLKCRAAHRDTLMSFGRQERLHVPFVYMMYPMLAIVLPRRSRRRLPRKKRY